MDNIDSNLKNNITGVFSRSSATYDENDPKFFSYFGNKLVNFANLKKGETVLDVACGRGASLFPALKSVGEEGYVIGIDLAEGMVNLIRSDLQNQNISNAEIHLMDAESMSFDDESFDCIICGLAIFFFPDVNKALQQFLRVLKPGGKLCISTFKKLDEWEQTQKWLNKLFNRLFSKIEEPHSDDIEESNPTKKQIDFSTESGMRDLLRNAGFNNILTKKELHEFYHKDENSWYAKLWSDGIRHSMEEFELHDLIYEFKEEAFSLLQQEKTEKGIMERIGTIYTIGFKNN